jgi:uncharacterized protein YfaT (DUF1175 family)
VILAVVIAASAGLASAQPPSPPALHVEREGERGPSELLLRKIIAETAAAQVAALDPAWEEGQRDCAGLVRFAYRTAWRTLAPERVAAGLFRDERGLPSSFADAATLLRGSFAALGRGAEVRAALQAGDLVAFAREEEGAPVLHLMVVVRAADPAHGPVQVVYHPGDKGAAARAGRLDALAREAPPGWRPVPENPLFLGFYRWKEWLR